MTPTIHIAHIYISPGHNFLGHHGQPAGEHEITEVASAECVAGRGLRGDRYFDHAANHKGQITFFAAEVLDALRRVLGLAEVRPSTSRRNIITRGADLNALVGVEFEIQEVRFAGVEECRPCYWMNTAFGDERVETWLRGRGGLRARILTDGVLRRES